MEYFITIAKEQNLSRASEKLYVSQPTLSKYIQRLEKEMGLTLFTKNGKRFQLTYAGQRFFDYATRFLSLKRDMDQEFLDIRQKDIGALRVGMPPFRCSFALPAVLPIFHEMYPNVDVQITEDNSSALDKALIDGDLDLSFYNLSAQKPELDYQYLKNEELFVILKKDHPIKAKALEIPGEDFKGIYLEWLSDETFLLQSRTQRQGEYVFRELQEKGIVPAKICENTNIRATASLAAGGYGIAFLSRSLLEHFQAICTFDRYALLDVNHPLNFVAAWRKGGYLPHYALEFIKLMQEMA